MQPVTACSSLMEVLPREMKPLMSCDSDGRAVTRTKARLPLCEVWFTSEEPEREPLKVHLLYSAIYFRGGKWTGIWQQTKTHQSGAIRWLQDTHSHLLAR